MALGMINHGPLWMINPNTVRTSVPSLLRWQAAAVASEVGHEVSKNIQALRRDRGTRPVENGKLPGVGSMKMIKQHELAIKNGDFPRMIDVFFCLKREIEMDVDYRIIKNIIIIGL